MDIIVVRSRLPRLPDVVAISRLAGRSRHETAGLLVDFWGWSLEAGRRGRVDLPHPPGPEGEAVVLGALADAVGGDAAFWRAVRDAGWLALTPRGIEVPNYERWMSPEAMRKAVGAATERSRPDQGELFGPAPARAAPPAGDWSLFDRFWAAYPRKEAKLAAKRAWSRLAVTEPVLRRMLLAIIDQRLAEREPKFRPHAATWLNGRRWEDERGEGGQDAGRGSRLAAPPGKYAGLGDP